MGRMSGTPFTARMASDLADGTFWSRIQDHHSHAFSRHAGIDDAALMERLLSDPTRHACSTWGDRHTAERAISLALMQGSLRLADGLSRLPDGTTFAIVVPLDGMARAGTDPPTGRGFTMDRDGHLAERESSAVRLVLHKSDQAPYGFTVKTAAPAVDAPSLSTATDRDLTPLAQGTRAWSRMSAVHRAFVDHALADDAYPVAFRDDPRRGQFMTLFLPVPSSSLTDRVFVSEAMTTTTRYDASGRSVPSPFARLVGLRPGVRSVPVDGDAIAAEIEGLHPGAMREISRAERIIDETLRPSDERLDEDELMERGAFEDGILR